MGEKAMKILAINGSPRGEKSTTYIMVEEFLKGTREFGFSTNHVLLSDCKIHHCIGCFHCWRHNGQCVFDDDMKNLLKGDFDILLLASPLYVDNVTGLMKNFLDRCVAVTHPQMELDKNLEFVHVYDPKNRKKLIMMSNCGFAEQSQFAVLRLLAKRMARNMQAELLGEIYLGEGPLLIRNDPRLKTIIENYKELLVQAGREIAQNLTISQETAKELEKPLIPFDRYLQAHNEIFTQSKTVC